MKKLSLKRGGEEKKTEKQRVEERREEVLARGRKFKYPLQYSKHRLIGVTVALIVVALVALAGAGYLTLYKWQSTNDILYRITQWVPVPVAEVDGTSVRYSDYLMVYNSTIRPVEQQGQLGTGEDAETMRTHYKRAALSEAEGYGYAEKLAGELGVTVSSEEVDAEILKHRQVGGVERSEESFTKILQDNFGLSMREYRRMIELSLLKMKVSEAIDKSAAELAKSVAKELADGANLRTVAEKFSGRVMYEETGGLVDRMNVDGGRAMMAMKLSDGQVSEKFVSSNGDGYYFVRLVAKTETSVNYESIKVPFTEFAERMTKLREEGKIKEYIELPSGEKM